MKDKITKVLKDKVDPILAAHYGGAVLTKYENGIAYVRLTGACASCPSAQQTIEDVVKSVVTGELDEVKDVILDTSVSEDLLDMARKILNKEITD
ncbi:MAG: NifU family protein [Clostridiales bacterium]|nr:NifU family protein [Clostridiales bacterium]